MLYLSVLKCGHIWVFLHVCILITVQTSFVVANLVKTLLCLSIFFIIIILLFTNKSLLIFFFVTMNKCFHVPFKNIKTGFWKMLGWTCALLPTQGICALFVTLRYLRQMTSFLHDNLQCDSKHLGSCGLILRSSGAVISSTFFLWLRFDFDQDLFASPRL